MITRAQLLADGCVPNPNMWIGDGWFHCSTCNGPRRHHALSHKGEADCFEVCDDCGTYRGRNELRTPATSPCERCGADTVEGEIHEDFCERSYAFWGGPHV